MENKSVAGQPPVGQYQTIPQPGQAPPTYPTDAPPKYEEGGYQQPPPSYPQPAYPQQQVYSQQPVIVTTQPLVGYGNTPKMMQCPHCQASMTTSMEYETGALTWLSAGLICIFGCWLGCCLIPFCIDDLQDVKHSCPNCRNVVGYFRRM